MVLNPLPFPQAERLVDVATVWGGRPGAVSVGNYLVMKERARTFESLAARNTTLNLVEGGDPERILGARVTANYFSVFGLPPALGRVFTKDEDLPGKPEVAVLSHRLFTPALRQRYRPHRSDHPFERNSL